MVHACQITRVHQGPSKHAEPLTKKASFVTVTYDQFCGSNLSANRVVNAKLPEMIFVPVSQIDPKSTSL